MLVDSETLAWQVWADVLSGHGVAVDAQDIREPTGRTQPDVYRAFAGRSPLPPEQVVLGDLTRRTTEVFTRHLRPFPDSVATILALVQRTVPVAVASSRPRWWLEASLRTVHLVRHVDVTVAGDEVEHGRRVVGIRRPGVDHGSPDAADCGVDRIEPGVLECPPPHTVTPSSRPR